MDSPYLKQTGDGNMIDYINFGPKPTAECDPHILKLKQIADETLELIEKEFCPEKMEEEGPLEKGMLQACVTATIRHYIVDVLLSGIITFSFVGSSRHLPHLIIEYIMERMQQHMASYGEEYYFKFLEIFADLAGVDKSKVGQAIRDEIVKQHKEIVEGFLETAMFTHAERDPTISFVKNIKTLKKKYRADDHEIPDSKDARNEFFVIKEVLDDKGVEALKLCMLVGGKIEKFVARPSEQFKKITIVSSPNQRVTWTNRKIYDSSGR